MAVAATGPTTAPAIQARSTLDGSVEVAGVEIAGDVAGEAKVGMDVVIELVGLVELVELVDAAELVTLEEANPTNKLSCLTTSERAEAAYLV